MLGKYRHYKGKEYRVIMVVKLDDSISNRIVGLPKYGVVYIPLYGSGKPSIRTIENFNERINIDNYEGPRFLRIGDDMSYLFIAYYTIFVLVNGILIGIIITEKMYNTIKDIE